MISDGRISARLVRTVSRGPLHVAVIGIAILWMIPTLGLLVSSREVRSPWEH